MQYVIFLSRIYLILELLIKKQEQLLIMNVNVDCYGTIFYGE